MTANEQTTTTADADDTYEYRPEQGVERAAPDRFAGVLAHPSSLPGPHGIGDLGQKAYAFVDWLEHAQQQRWQILPLGPTGYGNSPYASFSAFAGNPLLISLEGLVEDGLLRPNDLGHQRFPDERVDFEAVAAYKLPLLHRAAAHFRSGAGDAALRAEFERFVAEHAGWLEDYALFQAIKQAHDNVIWNAWPRELALREPAALARARGQLREAVEVERVMQFLFFRQWLALKAYANARDILVFGDVPIFVALDSVDVWANQELFQMQDGHPIAVSGVPPDYFSETGQLWGNPLYDWDAMAQEDYRWWVERFRATYRLVDIVRIDHFRGFESYWSVPAGEKTAKRGTWQPGPGSALFDTLRRELRGGEPLPVIAEDLGVITRAVDALREGEGFPGMAVLQFAFGAGAENPYLPHNLFRELAIYTGTHDNDTTLGWWQAADEPTRHHVRRYIGCTGEDIVWDLIRLAWMSVCQTAVVPLQDVLELGNEARMNLPGTAGAHNWGWRMRPNTLTEHHAERLGELTELYGRKVTPSPSPLPDAESGSQVDPPN